MRKGGVVCTHCGSHDGRPVYIIHAAEAKNPSSDSFHRAARKTTPALKARNPVNHKRVNLRPEWARGSRRQDYPGGVRVEEAEPGVKSQALDSRLFEISPELCL